MTDDGVATVQTTFDGDRVEEPRDRPDTFVACAETGQFILRSARHDWPHRTVSLEEWFGSGGDGDTSPYDEYDADEEVGKWYDITLSYSVDYRFRVPAFTDHRAEEIAKEWKLDARPADSHHVHTDKREVKSIERQDLPGDWDPYGPTPIHEALENADEEGGND